MRSWERAVEKPPVRRGYDHHPSFSSSLLDSIYRSIDDDEEETRPDKPARGAPHHNHHKQHTSSRWASQVAERSPAVIRSKKQSAAEVTRPRQFQTSTSSSSDCSSYGGFSSSETESVASRPKPNRLRPIRTEKSRPDSLPPRPPSPEKKKIKNLGSIRSKLRDLKKSRSPTSPAARLAGFLNNLFNSKHKSSSGGGAARGSGFSGQDSASSFSRSCLVKTPSLAGNGGERTVRFQLPLDGNFGGKTAPPPPARKTWRIYEDEDDDVASDSSSDLFELENLTAIGRYRDELPVYETTHLGGRARLVNF